MAYEPLPFTADDFLTLLTGQIGTVEKPANSNRTPYGAATGVDGVPWCAIFIGWGLRHFGVDPAAYLGTRTWRYCPAVMAAGRANGRAVPVANARPGDLVLYSFGGPVIEHIGVCVHNAAGTITTVEGNTSPGVSGSQANGGGVYERSRPWAHVAGVLRPRYAAAGESTAARPAPIAEDGQLGPATISRWQQIMHTPVDGVIDTPRSSLVAAVQAALNKAGCRPPLVVDGNGIWQNGSRSDTIASLQRYLGVAPIDGRLDAPTSATVKALQRRLNAGRF